MREREGGCVVCVRERGFDDGITEVQNLPPPPSLSLQIVLVLKKEVASTSNGGGGEGGDQKDVTGYRQSLVRTLHHCSVRFSIVAPAVVPLVS